MFSNIIILYHVNLEIIRERRFLPLECRAGGASLYVSRFACLTCSYVCAFSVLCVCVLLCTRIVWFGKDYFCLQTICSTSLSGGNQVDGLPPASSNTAAGQS